MIQWINRYSDTMEYDELGRWARIAFIGKRFDTLEIAWIKKFDTCVLNTEARKKLGNKKELFIVSFLFPRKGEILFKTIKEAKKQVEQDLEVFIKLCQTKSK